MNLQKAKEILDLNIRQRSPQMPPDVKDALKLGIEALDYINSWRGTNSPMSNIRLPSETTTSSG